MPEELPTKVVNMDKYLKHIEFRTQIPQVQPKALYLLKEKNWNNQNISQNTLYEEISDATDNNMRVTIKDLCITKEYAQQRAGKIVGPFFYWGKGQEECNEQNLNQQ